jgi:hypothetical protein
MSLGYLWEVSLRATGRTYIKLLIEFSGRRTRLAGQHSWMSAFSLFDLSGTVTGWNKKLPAQKTGGLYKTHYQQGRATGQLEATNGILADSYGEADTGRRHEHLA